MLHLSHPQALMELLHRPARTWLPLGVGMALGMAGYGASVLWDRPEPPPPPAVEPAPPAPVVNVPLLAPPMPPADVVEISRRVGRDTLGALLARAGVGAEGAQAVVAALHPVLDARRLRPGDVVSVRTQGGALVRLTVQRQREDGVPETIRVDAPAGGSFRAQAQAPEVRVELARLAGTVRGTLYETMVSAGETPGFINQFVDVFASQVDFYREVQNGDAFRVLVEKRFAGERFVGYGRILAAEYKQVGRTLRGFHHLSGDGSKGYYDERGRSLLTAFLKTPMELTRITSSFGMRFHPVLHEARAHNGVDYGAPTGTPVWTVADGRVTTAAFSGACGNMVLVQHGNGLSTGYCHLSRIGAGIRVGQRVSQKQVIGYVGTTGRSTGPHLHFMMKRNDQFVNPQRLEVPRKPGLGGAELDRYLQSTHGLATELDAIPTA